MQLVWRASVALALHSMSTSLSLLIFIFSLTFFIERGREGKGRGKHKQTQQSQKLACEHSSLKVWHFPQKLMEIKNRAKRKGKLDRTSHPPNKFYYVSFHCVKNQLFANVKKITLLASLVRKLHSSGHLGCSVRSQSQRPPQPADNYRSLGKNVHSLINWQVVAEGCMLSLVEIRCVQCSTENIWLLWLQQTAAVSHSLHGRQVFATTQRFVYRRDGVFMY